MIGHVKSWKLGSVHSLYDISVISGTKHRGYQEASPSSIKDDVRNAVVCYRRDTSLVLRIGGSQKGFESAFDIF